MCNTVYNDRKVTPLRDTLRGTLRALTDTERTRLARLATRAPRSHTPRHRSSLSLDQRSSPLRTTTTM